MGLSWHNFFFGALEPGARIAVDKPPIDLWLQVASTQLIGFNTTALLLPEALGGILAAGLLWAAIRPVFGLRAALLGGLALAVLPISVITSRSDTMDSVMMALLVAALWSSVRALRTRHLRWVVVAAGLVGLAFNVKLSEALIPLPALGLTWLAAAHRRRWPAAVAGAAVAFAAVGMAWIVIASLTPASQRPYPIGSRNGSIYAAVFVYNGIERLNGTSAQVAPIGSASTRGPTRLLGSAHPFYGSRIGVEVVAALAVVLAWALASLGRLTSARWRGRDRRLGRGWRRRSLTAGPREPGGRRTPPPFKAALARTEPAAPGEVAGEPPGGGDAHARRWLLIGVLVWLATATALFSAVRDLQPRYLEALSPAVAAAVGLGGDALLRRAGGWAAGLLLALALAACAGFAATVGDVPAEALTTTFAACGVAALTLLFLAARRRSGARAHRAARGLLGVAVTVALLAAPAGSAIALVDANATAAGVMGSGAEFAPYLHAHRHGAYYEVASSSVFAVTTLIVHDAQPVLVLSDFHGPLVSLGRLMELVRVGAVRHIIISHACRGGPHCPLTTRWSLKHAREVVRGGLYEYVLPLTRPLAPRPAAQASGARRR
jgi:4-amino-4-deoxy-L-arabinose transferase-like glycosyltransferase